MFDMTRFARITGLLEALEAVVDSLTPNERELFRHLKTKYAEPVSGAPDDLTCLEVMLRNIEIRKGFAVDAASASRVIEMERKGPDQQED